MTLFYLFLHEELKMNNPYCQNAAQSDKLSPLQDYVYPFHDKDVATPLSFFAFIAYLCLAVMHLLQFTDAEHFEGLYMDSFLHSFQPIAFILSLLWIVATLLALVPIIVVVVLYLIDKKHAKAFRWR